MQKKILITIGVLLCCSMLLFSQSEPVSSASTEPETLNTDVQPEETPEETPTETAGELPAAGSVAPAEENPAALAPASGTAAPGKEYIRAEGLENWQLEYDLSAYKPGKYNILVRAVDSAGNESFAGPFNIIVDPLSDLPLTQISHPLAEMRVGGDLIIVGTAVDDDAVQSVQVKLNDGGWMDAQGADYWSFLLETAELPDGLHQLSARAIDKFGVEGHESTVSFHLDRTKPLHSIQKPGFGALVSGRFAIDGTVFDANALERMEYSMDAGQSWRSLRLSLDRAKTTATFSLNVDTRQMEDGPGVVWFRTEDQVGSVGTSVFLYFVDNTKPQIDFISPSETAAVNGSFVVTGRVFDVLGITSLEWVYGKESGIIELLPGNPYFSQVFALHEARGRVSVLFRATDVTGNVTTATLTRTIDQTADLPRLELFSPLEAETYRDHILVRGQARDGDGIAAVFWRVDNGEEQELPTEGSFGLTIGELSSGRHTLSLRAVDANGISSPVLTRSFVFAATAPQISLHKLVDSTGEQDFSTGIAVSILDGKAQLTGSVEAANPLRSLIYSINGGPEQSLNPGKNAGNLPLAIPLPASLPYGVLDILVKATDVYDRVGELRVPVYAVNYSRPRVGPLLDFADAGSQAGGVVDISRQKPLLGVFITPFSGEDIRSVRLEPESALVRVSNSGKQLRVEWQAAGISESTRVVVETVRGHQFESAAMIFRTDSSAPRISLSSPLTGAWFNNQLSISGTAEDDDQINKLEYSVNEGSWSSLAIDSGSFDQVLDLARYEGAVLLSLRAADAAGNISVVRTAVMVDRTLPVPERIAPLSGAPADGNLLYAFRPGEPSWSVAGIEIERNGSTQQLAWAPLLTFNANAANGPVLVRVTDKAGNTRELDLAAGLNLSAAVAAVPALETIKQNVSGQGAAVIQAAFTGTDANGEIAWTAPFVSGTNTSAFPEELNNRPIRVSGPLSLQFTLSGLTLDPKKPQAFWGLTPETATQAISLRGQSGTTDLSGTLRVPVQADGRQSVWLKVSDTARGDLYTRLYLDYDTTPAQLRLLAPAETAPGSFTLLVHADDANGISSAEYEINREKKAFTLLPGDTNIAIPLEFPAKATQLAIIVRVVDGSGNTAMQTINVRYDRTADLPQAAFISPVEEAVYSSGDQFFVLATDNQSLASVSLGVGSGTVGAEGAGPIFGLRLPESSAGGNALSLVALDRNGLSSEKITGSVIFRASAPTIEISGYQQEKAAPESLSIGQYIELGKATAVNISVSAPNGLAAAEYCLNNGEWSRLALPAKPDASGVYSAQLPLSAALPYDRILLQLRVQDVQELVAETALSLYRVSPPSAAPVVDAEGIYLYDQRVAADGRLNLAPGEAVEMYFNGRKVQSVRMEPELPFLALSTQDALIRLQAVSEGWDAAAQLVVSTEDGEEFRSREIIITSDASDPRVAITGPVAGSWLQENMPLKALLTDSGGIASAEYSLDDGKTWLPLPLYQPENKLPESGQDAAPAAETADSATESIESDRTDSSTVGEPSGLQPADPTDTSVMVNADILLSGPDGAAVLQLRAYDRAGRTSIALLPFIKDTQPAELAVVAPQAADVVNGSILLVLEAADAGTIDIIEYALDGESWQPVPAENISRRGSQDLLPSGRDAVLPEFMGYASFAVMIDFSSLPGSLESLSFRVVDTSGNIRLYQPLLAGATAFTVDVEADKPVLEIQIPDENEVMQADFTLSGMIFDDDGVSEVFWRLDEGEWQSLPGDSSFSVPFTLQELEDNEHLFEAYAVDVYGVAGETVSRQFRVSREEPAGQLLSPDVSITNRTMVVMNGVASDANGIKEVWISFDNGNSWNRAVGTEEWEYTLDTRILQDGVHSIYLRFVDGYDITGFSAGLISVDNTAPLVDLDTPFDGDEFIQQFTVGGRVSDGVFVEALRLEIRRLDDTSAEPLVIELPTSSVFSRSVDISQLEAGWYNLRITAHDRAKNESYVSRNFVVLPSQKAESVEFIFPAHGEKISGDFSLDGRVYSGSIPDKAVIYLNNELVDTVSVSKDGFFSLPIGPDVLAAKLPEDGSLKFRIETVKPDGSRLVSEERSILYVLDGPWMQIQEFVTGDFIIGRPFVYGSVGWETAVVDKADKVAWTAYQELLRQRKVVKVEFSRDNGRSFETAKGTAAFRFRLETQEYPNGELRLLVRATFANGEVVVRKRIFTLDTLPPQVRIIRPTENGRFNQSIMIEGTASDLNGLKEVSVIVRDGDKASYEVPGFIQGSYLDLHLLGATRFEVGVGLSFFDDNVKLQLQIGQGFAVQPSWDNLFGIRLDTSTAADNSRFGGIILGAKLLANVAYLPFSYWFGPDLDFFSMSFGVGASFTYFSQQASLLDMFSPPDGKYMVLSGVIAQWEFAKFTFDLPLFRSYGFYVEGGLIFIPSEVSTKLEEFIRPTIAFGLRISVF
ncbi:MAG: hypothetical protein KKI09_11595 [Spirochaetes bacterium]|nr:hypothetical protein [Spirochaetota bacterium]